MLERCVGEVLLPISLKDVHVNCPLPELLVIFN